MYLVREKVEEKQTLAMGKYGKMTSCFQVSLALTKRAQLVQYPQPYASTLPLSLSKTNN